MHTSEKGEPADGVREEHVPLEVVQVKDILEDQGKVRLCHINVFLQVPMHVKTCTKRHALHKASEAA